MLNSTPTITIELLSEYALASAVRRASIIDEMRNDKFYPFKNWYPEVKGAYRRFLLDQCETTKSLDDLINIFVVRPAKSDDAEAKILKQLEAIECIIETDHSVLTKEIEFTPANSTQKRIEIQGVSVRVSPVAITVQYTPGNKEPLVGAIKPYWVSTGPLSQKRADILSEMLFWYAETCLSHIGNASPKLCHVSEIFAKRFHSAPKARTRLRKEIEAMCLEIAQRWHVVENSSNQLDKKEK